mmetsp:Transcript_6767/g.19812  ORF Transcript_6767/g.19812 Transcript_6767/m.19812 type:complete len:115 (+) Transcript_6767:90-434(+)
MATHLITRNQPRPFHDTDSAKDLPRSDLSIPPPYAILRFLLVRTAQLTRPVGSSNHFYVALRIFHWLLSSSNTTLLVLFALLVALRSSFHRLFTKADCCDADEKNCSIRTRRPS